MKGRVGAANPGLRFGADPAEHRQGHLEMPGLPGMRAAAKRQLLDGDPETVERTVTNQGRGLKGLGA
jgi:hypothetical protein